MTVLNQLLVRLADLAMAPLAALPPTLGVTLAALATALFVLGVVRATSDQRALAAVKRQIQADLFEMRLFNDDLRALLRAQGAVLRHNGRYLRLSLVPLLCTAIPLALAIGQLQAWYGYDALTPGQRLLVTADLAPGVTPADPQLSGEGIEVDGPATFFPSLRQVVWRVTPTAAAPSTVHVQVSGVDYEKTLDASVSLARRSPLRPQPGVLDQLLAPWEPPLPDGGPVTAIHVPYPERTLPVLGLSMHWLALYLAATFLFVLLLRRPLGVVI